MNELVNQQPELKKRVLSAKQQRQHNTSLGAWGESRAIQFLSSRGLTILAKNIIAHGCEIDIVALDAAHQELVFIEVKTRKCDRFGHPSQAINHNKLKNMCRVATTFIRRQKWYKPYRFDSIIILPGRVEHFENITWDS